MGDIEQAIGIEYEIHVRDRHIENLQSRLDQALELAEEMLKYYDRKNFTPESQLFREELDKLREG